MEIRECNKSECLFPYLIMDSLPPLFTKWRASWVPDIFKYSLRLKSLLVSGQILHWPKSSSGDIHSTFRERDGKITWPRCISERNELLKLLTQFPKVRERHKKQVNRKISVYTFG